MPGLELHDDTKAFSENNLYLENPGAGPALSPLEGDYETDACIIGAGLTGLACAHFLGDTGIRACIIDAHHPGWGASGRNGGQLWPGYFARLQDIEKSLGRTAARDLWRLSLEGMAHAGDIMRGYGIDCEYAAGAMYVARTAAQRRALEGYMDLLTSHYGYTLTGREGPDIARCMGTEFYIFGAHDARGAGLHPLQYVNGLARAVARRIPVFVRTPVTGVVRTGAGWQITTPRGTLRAQRIVLAGDGYLGQLIPELRRHYVIIRNAIVATRPLPGPAGDGMAVCEYDDFLQFFRRTADNRIVFGGGDTIRPSFRPQKTQERIVQSLTQNLPRVFPQLVPADVTHRWGGYIAMTQSFLPNVGRWGPDAYYAHGFSGHGLALTHAAGHAIASAMIGDDTRLEAFGAVRNMRFPGIDGLDFILARAGMALYSAKSLFTRS